ncbi:hypothetical protein SAY86_022737 [Trapa natans]|uniref:F-box protein n=1 Tax=Trapa natans TaxID=22666 RepID=A0AAN7R794_TRANT|nr:hypothetical protein SAY86_022737 [Trapa natans]
MAVCCNDYEDVGTAASISSVHPDVIRAHILTRLDGPTLATLTCASPEMRALSSDDGLWQDICTSTWPSTRDPLARRVIASFSSGHRSFFSDSYPLLHRWNPPKQRPRRHNRPSPATELISAVDIFYKDEVIFSKVHVTETESGWFRSSPFRIDMVGQKETVVTSISRNPAEDEDEWMKHLEENMKMSWIVMDAGKKRAVNLSSRNPVSVLRHWLTGEVLVKYATVVAGEPRRGSAAEVVQFAATVTFGAGKSKGSSGGGGGGGGEWEEVTEVNIQVEDMEGRILDGRDSLVILTAAMESGRRMQREATAKEGFEEFEEMKRERKRRQHRAERALDMACIVAGVTLFVAFWSFILFR